MGLWVLVGNVAGPPMSSTDLQTGRKWVPSKGQLADLAIPYLFGLVFVLTRSSSGDVRIRVPFFL